MKKDEYEMSRMRPGDEEEQEANAPLIDPEEFEDEEHQHEEEGEEEVQRKRKPPAAAKTTLRTAGIVVWLLTFSAGISGLLFGYDTGVISSTLVSIGSDLSGRELTTADKSLITAITSLFALIFSPTTGYFADKYGRRFVILVASLLFILGALMQAIAAEIWLMVLGRAAVGAAVGLASCATPLYIAELAPAELRGRLVTIQCLFITGGQVVAYLIGWRLADSSGGWRWMVGLGAVPAIVQAFLLTFIHETPRWLVKNGKPQRARSVLYSVYGGLNDRERITTVDSVLFDIQVEIATEAKLAIGDSRPTSAGSTLKSLIAHPPHRRALTIACMLQALQQLCGFNSLMYFSATIFERIDFTNPIGVSLIVAGTNFVFTVAAFAFIDLIGRRNILLLSIPFMIIGLAICSVSFQFLGVIHTDSTVGVHEGGLTTIQYTPAGAWPAALVASMIVYVAAYAIGLGCVPWQQSELFPLRVRSFGSGIATATNWSSNFVIGYSFLPMMNGIGATATFATYAVVCVVGWVAVFMFYPETAGLELEGVGELLKSGFGVRESVARFKAGKKVVLRKGVGSGDGEREM